LLLAIPLSPVVAIPAQFARVLQSATGIIVFIHVVIADFRAATMDMTMLKDDEGSLGVVE
jgi:hypothetical protein